MSTLPGEVPLAKNEGLNEEQVRFLFGNQGDISDDMQAFEVFRFKVGYAYEWLASMWPANDETLLEFQQAQTKDLQEIEETKKEWPDFEVETFGVNNQHPVAFMLHSESATSPLYDRPILSTALLYANEAIGESPEGEAKIKYVIDLFEEQERQWWNSGRQGGDTSPARFPEPIEPYRAGEFPVRLALPELLF